MTYLGQSAKMRYMTSAATHAARNKNQWKEEGRDLMRAIAGGTIFGMPLLYSMEIWWHGVSFSPLRLLSLLGAVLLANFVFCLFLGFRKEHSPREALSEAICSVAIGCLISVVVLALIGELDLRASPLSLVGKVLMEAMLVSIGVSATSSRFFHKKERERATPLNREERETRQFQQDLRDAGATLAGALIFAFNTAPTEEIPMIASRLSSLSLLILLLAEFGLCYLILFASGFWKREGHVADSLFQHPLVETLIAFALSLLVAAGLLALLGHGKPWQHWPSFLSATVVLGFPAVAGGGAGRLVL